MPRPDDPHAPRPIGALRHHLAATPGGHLAHLERALEAAAGAAAAHVFIGAVAAGRARAAADAADARVAAGAAPSSLPPLAGLPVTIKDLYDIEGELTRAGSRLREGEAPAARDAAVVLRLRAAGAALVGRTNMSEFAFSGVGWNPHFGTPRNPCDAATARVPGGSSSGAAVSVALGIAVAALGSDTGGSIRIPAALCGLVGFKNTQSRTPLAGAFPLSFTLDTACAITRSVADAIVVDGVLAGAPLDVPALGARGLRFAVPRTLMFDAVEPAVARAFERACTALSAAGAEVVEIELAELGEIAAISSRPAGFAPIEAFAIHREAMATRREAFDPRVAQRIALGEGVLAADYIRLVQARAEWIARTEAALAGFDALLCPTVPIVAPALAPLEHDDAAFFKANGLLLRNTTAINFLDGCAFSLPCHAAGELPVGLMLAAPRGRDAHLAGVALAVERLVSPGATAPAAA